MFVAIVHLKIMFQCLILSFDLFICLKIKNNVNCRFVFKWKRMIDQYAFVNIDFRSKTMFIDVSNINIIFSNRILIKLTALIFFVTKIYKIIFVYLFIIIKQTSYTWFLYLFEEKFIIKFIMIFFYESFDWNNDCNIL